MAISVLLAHARKQLKMRLGDRRLAVDGSGLEFPRADRRRQSLIQQIHLPLRAIDLQRRHASVGGQ